MTVFKVSLKQFPKIKDTASPTQLEILIFRDGEEGDSAVYLTNVIYIHLKYLVECTRGSTGKALEAAVAAVSFPFIELKAASPVNLSTSETTPRRQTQPSSLSNGLASDPNHIFSI